MSPEKPGGGFNPPPLNRMDSEAVALVDAALAKLKERNVTHDYCPRCETFDWSVDPVAISVVPLRSVPTGLPMAYYPAQVFVIQVVCKNCGYTMFHNLNVLGLVNAPRT